MEAFSRSSHLKEEETAPPDAVDDTPDIFKDLKNLSDISDMEKVEPDILTAGKDMDSSWILISSQDNEDGLIDVKDEGEKEEKMERETDEKEKEDVGDGEKKEAKIVRDSDVSMDFSILEMPGMAHLNVEVNKHKRSLSKKGSIAKRKRPTRAAIHQSGGESEDSLFLDSTDPKPITPDSLSEEAETEKSEKNRPAEENSPPPEKEAVPPPKKFSGGIKIPGLLDGLSKAKPFAKKVKKSPDTEESKSNTIKDSKMDTSTSADSSSSRAPEPSSRQSPSVKKVLPPPPTSSKPSALARMLPVPPTSKLLKDSQNKNIIEAEASVKPSALKSLPPSGQPKQLPPLKTDTSSPKPTDSTKTPPPVAKKPSVPSKPKVSPIKSSASISTATTNNMTTSLKDKESSPAPIVASKPVKKEPLPPSTAKSADLPLPPKPRLKPIIGSPKDNPQKTSSSPSILEKTKAGLSSVSQPLPHIDKASENIESGDKIIDKKENIPLSPTRDETDSPLIMENKKEKDTKPVSRPFMQRETSKDDDSMTELKPPRKASISGISPVSPPVAGDKSAPRKNSITGSAYAPIGFRSALERTTSTDGEGKSRTSSVSSSDGTKQSFSSTEKPSFTRQTSEGKYTVTSDPKPVSGTNDHAGEPNLVTKPAEPVNGSDNKLNSESVPKKTNGSIDGDNKKGDNPLESSISKDAIDDANGEKGSSPWGVQLRKAERKVPPPKPTKFNATETESPSNWRQSLGQKRKSSIPKVEPKEKPQEPEKPEWAKALSERRKRLINSGFIASDAK